MYIKLLQAPSTSLCLSILGLHEDSKMSGQLMLKMCDDLSRHLKPIAPGVPNPEVDYSLLLRYYMLKMIFFSMFKLLSYDLCFKEFSFLAIKCDENIHLL